MPRRNDIWRCGVIASPVEKVLADGIEQFDVNWLPELPSFRFIADPFGWQDAQGIRIYAEQYDYRTRHGIIEMLTLDDAFAIVSRQPCLEEQWHLSYPFVFPFEGALWMLPEAHRSGGLTLYRAGADPGKWHRHVQIVLDCVPVDASPIRYRDRWWLFYSPAETRLGKISHLHVAWANRLEGPWTPHPGNPVRIDRASARPGGTPLEIGGRVMLPVQDCTATYGGAVRPLWISELSETRFEAVSGPPLRPGAAFGTYVDGLHTLSACGDFTLIDAKRIDTSPRGLLISLQHQMCKAGRR